MAKTIGTYNPVTGNCYHNGLTKKGPCPTAGAKLRFGADGDITKAQYQDWLIHEIVKLIRFERGKVAAQLKNYKFIVPDNADDTEVVKAVSHALGRSKGFAKTIIMDIQEMEKSGKYSAIGKRVEPSTHRVEPSKRVEPSFTTRQPTEGFAGKASADGDTQIDYSKLVSAGATALDSLGNLFGGNKKAQANVAQSQAQSEQAKAAAAQAQAEAQKKMLDALSAQKKSSSSKSKVGLYVGLGIGFVILVGGVFAIMKFRKPGTAAATA
jgi:hypothetical protein